MAKIYKTTRREIAFGKMPDGITHKQHMKDKFISERAFLEWFIENIFDGIDNFDDCLKYLKDIQKDSLKQEEITKKAIEILNSY